MTRRLTPARALGTLVFALVLGCLVAGCDDFKLIEPPPDPPPPPFLLPRRTPENVLYDLRVIYDGADSFVKTEADTLQWGKMYQSLFCPDTFKFYFIPGDQPPAFAAGWWGLTEEVRSFESLLRHKAQGTVDDIKLTWTVNPSEPDIRVGMGGLLHPTWRHIYVTGILLDVVMGQNTFRVPNATADFYFAPDPADSTLWVITEWYDRQPASGGSSPPSRVTVAPEGSSWGRIKALYY